MLAFRFTFLFATVKGCAFLRGFLLMFGRFPTRHEKFCRVSSLLIRVISLLNKILSALKGDSLPRWLFWVRAPKPPPPELIVVFDFELALFMASDGFKVGIVLMTHRKS